jgi:hypothetical protein
VLLTHTSLKIQRLLQNTQKLGTPKAPAATAAKEEPADGYFGTGFLMYEILWANYWLSIGQPQRLYTIIT